jgi:fructoselysine 6-kinase
MAVNGDGGNGAGRVAGDGRSGASAGRPRLSVAAVGDNCVDRYEGSATGRFVGGNALNVAVGFAQMGYESAYLGRVGDDENGASILAALSKEGIDVSHVEVVDGPSGVTVVRLEEGERSFLSEDYGVALSYRLRPADLEFLRDKAWVHVARLPQALSSLVSLADRAPALSYDFTDGWDEAALDGLCPRLRVAFFSASSLDDDDARRLARRAVASGAGIGVVTRGARGVVACAGDRLLVRPAPRVTRVDTLGAGDAFIAGFVAAALEGADVERALDEGATRAAMTCTHVGGWRSREEVARP